MPLWKSEWPSPVWAVRRTTRQEESNAALADVVDDMVHSFAPADMPHAPDLRHVTAETVRIPCLVNTVDLEAGTETVLHHPRTELGNASALADTRVQRGKTRKAGQCR